MSNRITMSKVIELREKAATIKRNMDEEARAARANGNLSRSGQDQAIDDVYNTAAHEIAALRAEETRHIHARLTTISRKLSGQITNDPASIIPFRDAQDRAEQITEEAEAERIITRAIRSDDHVLAKAIAMRALDETWMDTYDQFKTAYPQYDQAVQDYVDMRHVQDGLAHKLAASAAYSITRPTGGPAL